MRKALGKTSKGAGGSGPQPRATGLPLGTESDEFKNFMELLRSGKRIKILENVPPIPEEAMVLVRLAHAIRVLREGSAIEPSTGRWLAEAVQKACTNPAKAAEALGLKRGRGRPKTLDDSRHLLMAIEVDKLLVEGLPLRSTKRGKCAISNVAVAFNASDETVELAWYTSRRLVDLMKAMEATEEGVATFSDKS